MREIIEVAGKSVISVNHKTHEVMVSRRIVEVVIAETPPLGNNITGGLFVEFVALSAEQIASARITLAHEKIGTVLLLPMGGPEQFEGFDYAVGDRYVEWRGYDLEDILEVGDMVRLMYTRLR